MICPLLQFFNKVQHGVVSGLVAKLKKTATTFATLLQQKSNTPKPLFISLLYPIFSICCNVAKILQQIAHSIFSPKYCLTGLSSRFVKNSFIVWPFFQQIRADTSQKTRKMGSIARTLPIHQGIIMIRMRFFMWFLPAFQRKGGGSICPTLFHQYDRACWYPVSLSSPSSPSSPSII